MLSLDDFEQAARRRLPRPIFGYIAGAAEDNQSLRANRDARALRLRAARAGERIGPLAAIRPVRPPLRRAVRHRAHGPERAVGLSRRHRPGRARASNIPAILSGTSLIPLEDVIQAAPGTWFQAYLPGDPARIDALVERARKAGYETLVLTVDIPVSANRENNVRTGFSTPLKPSLRLAWDG